MLNGKGRRKAKNKKQEAKNKKQETRNKKHNHNNILHSTTSYILNPPKGDTRKKGESIPPIAS
jgi:hypothetical protein